MTLRIVFLLSILLLPSSAIHAFQFVVTDIQVSDGLTDGSATATIPVGATVTIEIQMINDNLDPIGAIGALAFGFDPGTASFSNGDAVGTATNTSLLDLGSSGLLPQGGIQSGAGTAGSAPAASPNAPANRVILGNNLPGNQGPTENAILWFNGIQATLPTPLGSEANDIGLSGQLITAGDVHARLTFDAVSEGSTTIEIGPDGINGAVILGSGEDVGDAANTFVTITVPEPRSAVAGIAGLATVAGLVGLRRRSILPPL